jgi:crotonobetainyl-CoA:carnitine CoA-transferase CaiB-like acyl-CoA transferase
LTRSLREEKKRMLEGLKVIEYASYIAAPGAGGIMTDWGADVVKVEPPGGDPIRQFFASAGIDEEAFNPIFEMDNRGKRGVILDTSKPEGRDALLRLIDGADVFLTNVRPSGLMRAGLDPATVRSRNKKLIYCSLTGYGLEGPDRDRPGMDAAAFWARSGLASMFKPKGGEPIQLRTAFGDHTASLAIVAAVMAALYERQKSGEGRLLDASLLRTAHYVGGSDFAIQHARGRLASNRARAHAPNPLVNYFRTADDRWISLLQRQGERDWPKLARALKLEHLVDDPRFVKARQRRQNGADLVALLDAAFAERGYGEIAEALDAEEMIWAPVLSPAEAVLDPQAIAAGCVVETPLPGGGAIKAPAAPVRFVGADDTPKGPAPAMGQHTRAVLQEAGYSAAAIEAMYASGAAF